MTSGKCLLLSALVNPSSVISKSCPARGRGGLLSILLDFLYSRLAFNRVVAAGTSFVVLGSYP
jgi:hypothetical protein